MGILNMAWRTRISAANALSLPTIDNKLSRLNSNCAARHRLIKCGQYGAMGRLDQCTHLRDRAARLPIWSLG